MCSTSHTPKLVSKSVFCWDCAAGEPLLNLQPWAINHRQTDIYCVCIVRNRTEQIVKGKIQKKINTEVLIFTHFVE